MDVRVGHKEDWAPKNWCFRIVVLEKTLENPLDRKEIKPVNPKEIQHWIFIGRTDAEAPILWSLDAKSQFTGKDPDAGKKEKGASEGETVRYHHWLNGHELNKLWEIVEDRGRGTVHGVAKSWTQLSDWTTTEWGNRTAWAAIRILGSLWRISLKQMGENLVWVYYYIDWRWGWGVLEGTHQESIYFPISPHPHLS